MILQKLQAELKRKGRLSQQQLCRTFRVSPTGLDAMLAILIKRGHVHKSMASEADTGCQCQPQRQVWYSWHDAAQIATLEIR
ncbi:FeoC-like transcriptional regulator [Motilimonas pumila]|uniref:Transcriptional regulator HTH-type FeoC domain-containing protein n=1 Tax=Motilimonas pumila TaxID=2303987 RepID=A0A418YEV3_9GAMM|nr:FeoC-like transcriptional regulator [Motilimonas pumila]RJG47727.1 hypothetical protein D1Z90_10005 [Motilimonas pumila]